MKQGDNTTVDFTSREKAEKQLAKLKEKAPNEEIRRAIEKKQAYINKPICK